MKNISVEYAHIYTNTKIRQEHELSLQILESLKYESETLSFVVMVDDYSFPDPSFDYENFSNWLTEKGFAPDLLIKESALIPVCDEVLSLIENKNLKEEIEDYVKLKKYPCSLFIASWYLLRLGCIKSDIFNETLIAKKLINILPTSFKPFEDKGMEIISSTKFKGRIIDIENKYFEGRSI